MIAQLRTTIFRLVRKKSSWVLLFLPMVWGCFMLLSN